MFVAAYVVGGFLIASVYAMGMLRGRRDRYHRLGFIIPFTVAAIMTPIQMGVGDTLARWVYNNEPAKFAAIELVPKTSKDVPETLFGHLNSNGTVSGGIPIPGSGVDGSPTRAPGRTRSSRAARRTRRSARTDAAAVSRSRTGRRSRKRTSCTSRGTSWSGSARCSFAAVGLVRAELAVPARLPKTKWFLRIARLYRRARGAHDGSGLGRHRGRPPTLDRAQLHEGRRRPRPRNTGVWLTFLVGARDLRGRSASRRSSCCGA